jgi:hypothetical protein
VIGNVPASNKSNTEIDYYFTDNNPQQNGFYRIAEYDLDGRVQYSNIVRSLCNTTDLFKLWPNPVHEMVFINILSNSKSQAMIKIFDSKGALVKEQKSTLLQGNNQLGIDMRSLSNGIYSLSVNWNNGQMKKTVQVLKQ